MDSLSEQAFSLFLHAWGYPFSIYIKVVNNNLYHLFPTTVISLWSTFQHVARWDNMSHNQTPLGWQLNHWWIMIIYESVNRSSPSHSSHVVLSYGNFCCGPDSFLFSVADITEPDWHFNCSDMTSGLWQEYQNVPWFGKSVLMNCAGCWKHTLKAHWLEKPALTRVVMRKF